MSIPVDTWCLQCLLNRNLELVRPLGSDEKAHEFAKKLLHLYLDAPSDIPSPSGRPFPTFCWKCTVCPSTVTRKKRKNPTVL